MPKSWYAIKAAATPDVPAEVSIHDEIGGWGVTAQQFIAEWKAATANTSKALLTLNSVGGSTVDGFAIYNTLKASGKDITVRVLGLAASMASVVAMAGTRIEMPANALMMVHNAGTGIRGDAEDLRGMADLLDMVDNSIVGAYVARTGKTEAEVRALMAEDTFMSAQQAVELGFADVVLDELPVTASFDLDKLPPALREQAAKVYASAKPPVTPPAPAPQPPVALQPADIEAMTAAAGLSDYTPVFALDASLTTPELARAAVAVAASVRDLCRVVGQPDQADSLIRNRATYADARKALAEAAAAADEQARINTAPPTPKPPERTEINPTALWADIRALQANRGNKK